MIYDIGAIGCKSQGLQIIAHNFTDKLPVLLRNKVILVPIHS